MASGGTIPNNRTQTVTFFNTTGIIEKEKGIYLSPRFKGRTSDIGKEIRTIFLAVLNAEAVTDSEYTAIDISSWSPQDRNLVVRGNIDDFRLVTDEGDCLNYLVVTRNVTKGNVTNTYYYGLFINAVEQVGGSSIRLTLEPDDFTNIFYLHNKHTLTSAEANTTDYDPFNERMKNCHVNRQHYNRVEMLDSYYIMKLNMHDVQSGASFVEGEEISIFFNDGEGVTVTGTINYFDDQDYEENHNVYIEVKTVEEVEIGEEENWSSFTIGENTYQMSYLNEDIVWQYVVPIRPANQEIFLNQEESFKFKYQYRDKKYPYRLTDSEMQAIRFVDNFSNLSASTQRKILLSCISYLVVEMKSKELLTTYSYINVIDGQTMYNRDVEVKKGNLISDSFNRPNAVVSYPFFDIPDIFEKYTSAILAYDFTCSITFGTDYFSKELTKASDLFDSINQKALADWIYSVYIVRDVNIPDSKITISSGHINYAVMCPDLSKPTSSHPTLETVVYNKDIYIAGVTNDPDSIGQVTVLHQVKVQWGIGGDINFRALYASGCSLGLVVSGYDRKEISFDVPESIPDLKNNFYDPILEAEPYSFYSISFLNFELPFNKNRYYLSGLNIKLHYFLSINGAVKCSMIPEYNMEGKSFLYFNEGLSFTIDSALPLTSDSYSSYYYVNKAQMKNQFAVNDYNRGIDLIQHAFISGPNAVGVSASKRGYVGALTETGNQVMQMADEVVDWAQSNKVIDMNQKAKLADVGTKPDTIKQTGTDSLYDLATNEGNIYVNHYTIDNISYQSISKFLERIGYQVNLYSALNVNDRVGWNYIKLNSFDWNPAYDIMVGQEENLRKIFSNGVTLLHNKSYLTSGHNYETILDE